MAWRLLKTQTAGSHPQSLGFSRSRVGPKNCTLNKVPDDGDAVGLETTLLEQMITDLGSLKRHNRILSCVPHTSYPFQVLLCSLLRLSLAFPSGCVLHRGIHLGFCILVTLGWAYSKRSEKVEWGQCIFPPGLVNCVYTDGGSICWSWNFGFTLKGMKF